MFGHNLKKTYSAVELEQVAAHGDISQRNALSNKECAGGQILVQNIQAFLDGFFGLFGVLKTKGDA